MVFISQRKSRIIAIPNKTKWTMKCKQQVPCKKRILRILYFTFIYNTCYF